MTERGEKFRELYRAGAISKPTYDRVIFDEAPTVEIAELQRELDDLWCRDKLTDEQYHMACAQLVVVAEMERERQARLWRVKRAWIAVGVLAVIGAILLAGFL